MRVRPKAGMTVRHPQTKQIIPAEGIDVLPTDLYWHRRVQQGDVEVVDDSQGAAEANET